MATKRGSRTTPAAASDAAPAAPLGSEAGAGPGESAAEPTTTGGKAAKRQSRVAPGAGVAAADTPAVGRTRAASPETPAAEPTTAGGKAARKGRSAPRTGVTVPAGAEGEPAAALAPQAKKAAAKPSSKGGSKGRETYAETAARRKSEKRVDQLQADLRSFAAARPGGWNHDEWLGFLDSLRASGHDCSDPEAIGASLERERLYVVLDGIEGVGPKRVQALAERFGTLWSARHASVEELVAAGLQRAAAERVAGELRERYP